MRKTKMACSKAAELGAGLVETGRRNPQGLNELTTFSRRVSFEQESE